MNFDEWLIIIDKKSELSVTHLKTYMRNIFKLVGPKFTTPQKRVWLKSPNRSNAYWSLL